MLNILFMGDIVGSPGRLAIKKLIPDIRKKYEVDLCIANADNITHGVGTTREKIEEVASYGVDFFTNGDHVYRYKSFYHDLEDASLPVIRPANYPESSPGRGYEVVDLGKKGQVLIINLLGQVFIRENLDSPFRMADAILEKFKDVHFAAIVVDFHADATSEKKALGFYLDGRVTFIAGTHTHIPTADTEILPKGTGYVTDLGMVGPKDSILGENIETVLEHFISKTPHHYTLQEEGKKALQSVLATIDDDGKVKQIKRIDREIS